MSEAASDPYSPPAAKPALDAGGSSPDVSMAYMEAVRFPFQGPHGWMNILLLSVANLVPVVGPIVAWGYCYDTFESLFRQKRTYAPPLELDRLSDYLMRGVWVFIVQIVISMVFAIPGMILLMGSQIAGMAIAESMGDEGIPFMIAFMGLGHLLHFGLMAVMQFLLIPAMIRAGLTQDLSKIMDLGWYRSFIAKTWVEMIVATLLLTFLSIGYAMLGLMAFCVGIFFIVGVLLPTYTFLQFQLYLVFLSRGGQAVEMKEPTEKALVSWAK